MDKIPTNALTDAAPPVLPEVSGQRPERLRQPFAAGTVWRARLGVIVPSVNTVVEPWFSAVVPPGVAVHTSRMLLDNCLTPEAVRRMDDEEGTRAALQIASCRPDAIAYCCTASSIVQGFEYDKHLQSGLAERTGRRCFTAVRAIIEALRAVGARKIAVASPYPDAIDRMEHQFFVRAGFEIVGAANLGITDSFRLADPTPKELYELAHRAWHGDADALLISCLNTRSHTIVQMLEDQLGKPVITSTQATLWKLLRTAGIADAISGYGGLLSAH
jgi:maleate isomerase